METERRKTHLKEDIENARPRERFCRHSVHFLNQSGLYDLSWARRRVELKAPNREIRVEVGGW